MISGIIIATIVVAGVGVAIGFILGVADLKLHVDIDEKEAAILEALPGNNCGGCGYPGCSGCATAIAKGEAAVNQCPVGGAPVAETASRRHRSMNMWELPTADSRHRLRAAVQRLADTDALAVEVAYLFVILMRYM